MIKQCLILFLLLFAVHSARAIDWQLKRDRDGIRIFTGSVPNSNIKAIKAEFILNTSLSRLVAVLQDAKAHEQWVYSSKVSYLVKTINEHEQIYYSEMSLPWPLSNRDFVVDIQMSQDSLTKVLTIHANAIKGYIPEQKHVVRVTASNATWKATPLGNGKVKIEYTAQADPDGSVPAWIVNLFSDKGPYETFKKLNKVLNSDTYKNAHADFIKD